MSVRLFAPGVDGGYAVRPAALVEASHGARAAELVSRDAAAALRRLPPGGGGAGAAAAALERLRRAYGIELEAVGDDSRRLGSSVELAAAEYLRTEAAVVARSGDP
jgi:hypothetical protein